MHFKKPSLFNILNLDAQNFAISQNNQTTCIFVEKNSL
jgi:hypothetical protein